MSWTIWAAIIVVAVVIYALVKRWETKLVLLAAGFFLAALSLDPMMAFKQFDKSMTNGGLIVSICSAMGFATVVSLTKCDVHLVTLLTRPLRKMGILLLPLCMIVTGCIAVAIPSTAGCCAAVGPTLIPLLIRSGFRPAIAGAAVVGSITPGLLNPGSAHNVFISKLADVEVINFIGKFAGYTLAASAFIIIVVFLLCLIYHDYNASQDSTVSSTQTPDGESTVQPNLLYAVAPLIPVIILVAVSIFAPELKMSVATAMLLGSVYAIAVTRTSPEKACKEFFNGMGRGYASILGIIIAAGVFVAGLRAAGVVDLFVNYLQHANEVAKIGGATGPYLLGLVTGSGDAATFAFNEAVTPHAEKFGLSRDYLGYLAMLSGHLGRLSSPLCGGLILTAGLAGVNPLEIVKRTLPAMLITLIAAYFIL